MRKQHPIGRITAQAPGWRHAPQLDAMRAVAIVIVLISHLGFEKLVPGGFGVTIFFFLSGYLITSLMRLEVSATGGLDLRRFYLRRTVRIIPPFLMAIAFALTLQMAGLLRLQATPPGIAMDLLFLSNYTDLLDVPMSVQIPLWSLDVEEHFYIGFSTLFALFFVRRSPRFAAALCGAACLAILAVRYGHVLTGTDVKHIYFWTHTRVDSILFGCILALWNNPLLDDGAWRPGFAALALAAALLLLGYVHPDEAFRRTLSYTLQGMALFVGFSWLLHLDPKWDAWFAAPPVRWLGLLSYTLYLIHLPMLQLVGGLGVSAPWFWGYLLALLYAFASYRLMEQPLRRWRGRFEKRRFTEREVQAATS